ncbi:hypothetical protein L596_018120 [Steinernema carpocapsae]|uniref:Uncharacterized protein n=1 Tax=Steinernema carpocapsae TaxID=34508 RepID=A0A4U5N3Y8_STECR|nr:hypothetical protein L596_018120 [Steinernema carpocapsae]
MLVIDVVVPQFRSSAVGVTFLLCALLLVCGVAAASRLPWRFGVAAVSFLRREKPAQPTSIKQTSSAS